MPNCQKSVVWIASYPKSGNTWLRFLACNLVFGRVESADALNRLVPDLHELREPPELAEKRILMKTHFPYSPSMPLSSSTAAAIYIVREPADVMLSNYHYSRRTGASVQGGAAEFDQYVDAFIEARGDPRWCKLSMGTWEGNVRSWSSAERDFPVFRVKYEDLLAEAMAVAARLCQFLGLCRTPEQIANAVEGASFERLQAIEECDIRERRIGIFYKPYLHSVIDSGMRFMRVGKSGRAAEVLTTDQQKRFEAVFGPVRREMGYS